jgi:hypothetical protein
MFITLQTELTAEGVVCTHETLGKVATIVPEFNERHERQWYVRPYVFPPYERGAKFKSMRAAEYYAVALGYEMFETRENNNG